MVFCPKACDKLLGRVFDCKRRGKRKILRGQSGFAEQNKNTIGSGMDEAEKTQTAIGPLALKRREIEAEKRRQREAAIAAAEKAQLIERAAREQAESAMARGKFRHMLLMVMFFVIVVVPIAGSAAYLWGWAQDQYASTLGFTVRKEEVASPSDLLGGIANLSSAGASDTDVLYEFIQSQELVKRIDRTLDLRGKYSAVAQMDPIFAFDTSGTIEDLTDYWRRMVHISYDSGSGLIEVRSHAFSAEDAHVIAQEILKESSLMINRLSAIAREDSTKYARADLEQSVERLKAAREAVTEFRSRTRIVDPSTVLQGQVGILNTLQQQLAEAYIELDLLRETTRDPGTRMVQVERKIEVIQERINQERSKFSVGEEGQDYATIVSEFERLTIDRDFAEQTYTAALKNFDVARADAQRQSRYLASYIQPTLAEKAEYPQRWVILSLVALFSLLAWAIITLIFYSLRDRR